MITNLVMAMVNDNDMIVWGSWRRSLRFCRNDHLAASLCNTFRAFKVNLEPEKQSFIYWHSSTERTKIYKGPQHFWQKSSLPLDGRPQEKFKCLTSDAPMYRLISENAVMAVIFRRFRVCCHQLLSFSANFCHFLSFLRKCLHFLSFPPSGLPRSNFSWDLSLGRRGHFFKIFEQFPLVTYAG